MPYHSIMHIIMESVAEGDAPYTILYPDMPTSLEDLQKGWIQLKEERDSFEAQLYASEEVLGAYKAATRRSKCECLPCAEEDAFSLFYLRELFCKPKRHVVIF